MLTYTFLFVIKMNEEEKVSRHICTCEFSDFQIIKVTLLFIHFLYSGEIVF